ncbi:MAG: RNA polymerase sigma factor [Gammaproteobacteria bacterium]|nr:RNA polymerase sigma factor [Gammaproteobacteria bacterium]
MQLEQFIEQSEQRAYQTALYATRNSEDALDIVQDAMMKLAQQYSDKPSVEWGPLFHKILQSKIHDWYRRRNVRQKWIALNPFSIGGGATDGGSNGNQSYDGDSNSDPIENAAELKNTKPDDKLAQSRAMNVLNDAVQNLPQRQQQVFLLRTWDGLNVAETASAMGCSQGSVKTHYSRAVHKLRELLEDHI